MEESTKNIKNNTSMRSLSVFYDSYTYLNALKIGGSLGDKDREFRRLTLSRKIGKFSAADGFSFIPMGGVYNVESGKYNQINYPYLPNGDYNKEGLIQYENDIDEDQVPNARGFYKDTDTNREVYISNGDINIGNGKNITTIKAERDEALEDRIKNFNGSISEEGGNYNTYDVYDTFVENPTNLLDKTRKLFGSGVIKTLNSSEQTTIDGYSKGRALKCVNGEYCRVWTYNKQYATLGDTMKLHEENNFNKVQNSLNKTSLRPNNGGERLNNMSVLHNGGVPTIAPYDNDESIKKCMFSIENLAWKGIKNDNNQNLTKSQTGPNGGRIMWFPPYNLKFTENVSVNWDGNNDFIGRGEKIYTYTNTERSGTLSFSILVDHPSILNAWSKNLSDTKQQELDNYILRFFAGCDVLPENVSSDTSNENIASDAETMNKETELADDKQIIKILIFFPNYYTGFEHDDNNLLETLKKYESTNNTVSQSIEGKEFNIGSYKYLEGINNKHNWYYCVDDAYRDITLRYYYHNGFNDGNNINRANNIDTTAFALNNLQECNKIEELKNILNIEDDLILNDNLFSFSDIYEIFQSGGWNVLKDYLSGNFGSIGSINVKGYASSDGTDKTNNEIIEKRTKRIADLFRNKMPQGTIINKENGRIIPNVVEGDVSAFETKLSRMVEVEVVLNKNNDKGLESCADEDEDNTVQINETKENDIKEQVRFANKHSVTLYQVADNNYPTDNEYQYFQKLTVSGASLIGGTELMENILKKVKYFNPAFHSITPEGFNARLTFLHQCTRQGPSSLVGNNGVHNLSFGRAPYCVLRLGDFYYSKILIDSMSIDYGDHQWDLNPEGIGLQPILANVNLNIKFIGGQDISGPIERLQNAVSFNYYSNTSVYDRRSDYRNKDNGDVTSNNIVLDETK